MAIAKWNEMHDHKLLYKTTQINIKNRATKMNLSCPGLSCPPNLSQILNFGKNRKFQILNPSENQILDP